MSFLSSYKSSILLLLGILIGGTIGVIWPTSAVVLQPIGDIFMNLLFVLIVPMVLFSVASSIQGLTQRKVLGSTLASVITVMVLMVAVVALITLAGIRLYPPVGDDFAGGAQAFTADATGQRSIGQLIVDAVTVTDFCMLLSVKHILPLMLVSGLLGWAVAKMQQPRLAEMLNSGCALVMKMMDTLMLVAPFGLGCYFAGIMADGSMALLTGYGRFVLLYLGVALVIYLLLYPIAIFIASGRDGLRRFFPSLLPPSLMAVSTLSSSACMPCNIHAAKQLGADPEVADAIVPLGTQIYKLGSVISGVMKVAFVMLLCGHDVTTFSAALLMLSVGVLSSVVVGAVPVGAGTGELLICSILGADPAMVGLLMVTSTLIDMPGTLLNVSGNTVLPLLTDRLRRHH